MSNPAAVESVAALTTALFAAAQAVYDRSEDVARISKIGAANSVAGTVGKRSPIWSALGTAVIDVARPATRDGSQDPRIAANQSFRTALKAVHTIAPEQLDDQTLAGLGIALDSALAYTAQYATAEVPSLPDPRATLTGVIDQIRAAGTQGRGREAREMKKMWDKLDVTLQRIDERITTDNPLGTRDRDDGMTVEVTTGLASALSVVVETQRNQGIELDPHGTLAALVSTLDPHRAAVATNTAAAFAAEVTGTLTELQQRVAQELALRQSPEREARLMSIMKNAAHHSAEHTTERIVGDVGGVGR